MVFNQHGYQGISDFPDFAVMVNFVSFKLYDSNAESSLAFTFKSNIPRTQNFSPCFSKFWEHQWMDYTLIVYFLSFPSVGQVAKFVI